MTVLNQLAGAGARAGGIQSRKSPVMGPRGAPGLFDWGDLDGDGDLDLVVSSYEANRLVVYHR